MQVSIWKSIQNNTHMAFYNREPVPLQDPGKEFTDGGIPIGFTALDYWRFQFSNFWDAQEEIAEFLVAKALGLELPHNKNGWTTFDIKYKGKRIEIKTTSYFHSWRGDGKVSPLRTFGIPKTHGQHDEYTENAERKNDVYVFCLNKGNSFAESDPFELSHWEFYVVPTYAINRSYDDRSNLSLRIVQRLSKEYGRATSYKLLKAAIDEVLAENPQ